MYCNSPMGILLVGNRESSLPGRSVPNPLASRYSTFSRPAPCRRCMPCSDNLMKSAGTHLRCEWAEQITKKLNLLFLGKLTCVPKTVRLNDIQRTPRTDIAWCDNLNVYWRVTGLGFTGHNTTQLLTSFSGALKSHSKLHHHTGTASTTYEATQIRYKALLPLISLHHKK